VNLITETIPGMNYPAAPIGIFDKRRRIEPPSASDRFMVTKTIRDPGSNVLIEF